MYLHLTNFILCTHNFGNVVYFIVVAVSKSKLQRKMIRYSFILKTLLLNLLFASNNELFHVRHSA